MLAPVLLRNSPERILETLYRRHVGEVYRYSMAMLDRPADAEDATQTTFLNAYRALERGERPRDAGPWLRAIALNVCREHHRRAGRRVGEVSLDDDPGDLVVEPQAPELGDLVRGLSCLPFNQRSALVMREFEGRSLQEIAVALEVTPSAVETLLFRARRALREQLDATLTCTEAERAISRQLDRSLARRERGRLRAHLRACPDCASLARRMRAQRSSIRSLGVLIPIPASLRFFRLAGDGTAPAQVATTAGAGTTTGGPVIAALMCSAAGKIAAVTAVGAAAIGLGYASLPRHTAHTVHTVHTAPAAPAPRIAAASADPVRVELVKPRHRAVTPVDARAAVHARGRATGRARALSHRRSRSPRSETAVRARHERPRVSRGVGERSHGERAVATSARAHGHEHGKPASPGHHGHGR